jgi:asparagine synthase (glutamine-hydrolysing)
MYIVLAWLSERSVPEHERRAAQGRFNAAVSGLTPSGYLRHDAGGEDWGVTLLYCGDQGAYRWPILAVEGPVTAVSLGLPVGMELTGGPVGLARRLLDGTDVHRDVVPPFGLIALADHGRFAVQQDWLGMCRLFTGTAEGITVVCNRPSLTAAFLHDTAVPDLDAWASYAVGGHFGGDTSPVSGVRLLRGGERVTGRRRAGGGWDITAELRYAVDDVVMSGYAGQGRHSGESLDRAASAITGVAKDINALYADEINLGLSGGKDSRLIAASLVAAGLPPTFTTNEDTAAEGEVARRLTEILRDKRGLRPEHKLIRSGAAEDVLRTGLRERTVRLQRLHDFQFPSSYLARPAVDAQLPARPRPASLTGAAGELSTGYWYPKIDDQTAEDVALARLTAAVPKDAAADSLVASGHERIRGLLGHARDIGLSDLHLLDYLYLTERLRRWSTSAYITGMVTPLLSPGFVAATFSLTTTQKRERLLHTSLIARLVPEWAEVPFVSISTGTSTATQIWEGDGVRVMADLLETARGPLAGLIRPEAVEKALTAAVRNKRVDPRTLRQFTWLAMASEQLEPTTVQPASAATYARITTPARKPAPSPARRPSLLRRLKKTRLWKGLRRRLR